MGWKWQPLPQHDYREQYRTSTAGGLSVGGSLWAGAGRETMTPVGGSAHARNGKGCGRIEAVHATVLPREM